ncbi:Stichel-like [Thalictrum thalictroides]|uniref:Stichel-like n=1 Tax=Thalictrum thalictroides TaxID=46969 RepID=A0A7J6W0L7_THATH|nr:Stichel-like [Thalictrum thalictroides]
MTRAVHGRFHKDDNGAISDHLRNHVHLTNCIHLKNHMHKQSPILAERSLMRDLIALQRSRSLRDPSTSPPSWHSPSILDLLSKKRDAEVHDGRRRSVGLENRREARRFSGSSAPVGSVATSKVAAADAFRFNDEGTGISKRSSMDRVRDGGGVTTEKFGRVSRRSSGGLEEAFEDAQNSAIIKDLVSRKAKSKDEMISPKGRQNQNIYPKTLAEELHGIPLDSDGVQSSNFQFHGRHTQKESLSEEPGASIRGHRNELARIKKRKVRGARRARAALSSRDFGRHNEMSVTSNPLAQGSNQCRHYMEDGEGKNVEQDPRNGCGIPWNWSRIHHRGKTILDIAGRSLSCGLSDSRLRKGGSISQSGLDMPVASDHSCSSTKSNAEATPLLVEPSGSQESIDDAARGHEYSGELGIFADHCLNHDIDSDLASEARSGRHHNERRFRHGRHQSLTQKYMPRSFRDLVGQNLVVQALSNAVSKRKVGFLYVFYGPHGTGKTSCARIFARALNCQSSEHPKPCGSCSSCVAHDLGKSRNVREVGPVGNINFDNFVDLLDNMSISQLQSQYRIFIFDDCDTLPPNSWSAISKVIDRAPRRVVFLFVSTHVDHLPHIIISRCQKFFFPKLKDADIIYTLQWIASKEDLEIDRDALKLVASRSDGSLRDAEMTLEQLSLLGQRISVPLVQELVGLISDEKLVDLLDLALSADTVNTVKTLREIMEAGGEPLALMSQLATIITDILAGSYVFTKERLRRKFFRRPTLSKDDMEKLRQALKTLSEAEKQLRTSNDKLTWLTAALLQLAPDQQYLLPSSSTETSFNHSPLILRNSNGRDMLSKGTAEHAQALINNRHGGSTDDDNIEITNNVSGVKQHAGLSHKISDIIRAGGEDISGKGLKEIDKIWYLVLEKIKSSTLKQFMYQEGKLVSVNFGAAPTVLLTFSSHMTKSTADKYKGYILKAFESILGSPVIIEIRSESSKEIRGGNRVPLTVPASVDGSSRSTANQDCRMPKAGYYNDLERLPKDKANKGNGFSPTKRFDSNLLAMQKSEIIEMAASPQVREAIQHETNLKQLKGKGVVVDGIDESAASHQPSTLTSIAGKRKIGEQPQSQSIVRSKVSLAHVIQQAEGCNQRNGWSRRKAMSIAEKLEQENLRMESRSRRLLCWKTSRSTRGKLSRLRVGTRRPRSLLKLFPCSRCLSTKSPR